MGWEELWNTNMAEPGGEVMASIEWEGSPSRFIIADSSRDDAWISIGVAEAIGPEEHR